jgi:hypothetical protein
MDSLIWKPIKGYEGIYEISNDCTIRSLDRFIELDLGHRVAKRKFKGKLIKVSDKFSEPTVQLHSKATGKGGYYRVRDLFEEAFNINCLTEADRVLKENNFSLLNNGIYIKNLLSHSLTGIRVWDPLLKPRHCCVTYVFDDQIDYNRILTSLDELENTLNTMISVFNYFE